MNVVVSNLTAARNARARRVHEANVVDGNEAALLRGHGKLLEGLAVIAGYAQAVEVHQPKVILRLREALGRRLVEILRHGAMSTQTTINLLPSRTASALW